MNERYSQITDIVVWMIHYLLDDSARSDVKSQQGRVLQVLAEIVTILYICVIILHDQWIKAAYYIK